MEYEGEIWKDIAGYEGLYQISNYGRIKSYSPWAKGRVLSRKCKDGQYLTVRLKNKQHKYRSTRVHRLVAEAFIPNPHNYPQVNHIDGDKKNNHVDNLEWCTCSHNVRHSIKMHPHQLDKMIEYNKHIRPKRIAQISKNTGAIIATYDTATEAHKKTGVCARNILQVANRTPYSTRGLPRKTAGGYMWRFESEVMPK